MEGSRWEVFVVNRTREMVRKLSRYALRETYGWNKSVHMVETVGMLEAQKVIEEGREFHVGVIELDLDRGHSGLALCDMLRKQGHDNIRLILTGDRDSMPASHVLSKYDIDYFISTEEATPERIFGAIRSCLRISQDIATMRAYSEQLKRFTMMLQRLSSLDDLVAQMRQGLDFLEVKSHSKITFLYNVDSEDKVGEAVREAETVRRLHDAKHDMMALHPVEPFGGKPSEYVFPFTVELEGTEELLRGGVFVDFPYESMFETTLKRFSEDISFFIEKWKITYNTLYLQQKVERENMLREQMYLERTQTIANMVTGIAHEVNTPLGIATTGASMIRSLMDDLFENVEETDELKEIRGDMEESCALMEKNILRAHNLIKSFKQLSSGQMADDKQEVDLTAVVEDCILTMRPETKKRKMEVTVHSEVPAPVMWEGFPGHLSQAIINFIQNTLR